MKLNSKVSIAAMVSAVLFSGAASAAEFSNITSGSAEINVAERAVVLMNITPKAGLVSGPAKMGTLLATFEASSSNSNGAVAIRWGAGIGPETSNGVALIYNKTSPGDYLMVRLDAPELKTERDRWYVNGQTRINGKIVLQNDTNIAAGTYNITLEAASYTL